MLLKLAPKRNVYEAEAVKKGLSAKEPPPSSTLAIATSKKGTQASTSSPKKKASPQKGSKRPGPITISEPVAKKGRSSKSHKSSKAKGQGDQTEEVAIDFPADLAVLNKDGWDKVYPELHKLEFDYDKAALESLDDPSRVKKAIRHHMKVYLFSVFFISE